MVESSVTLVKALHAVLPQTQCRRCGYADCLAYAQAMSQGEAPINQCPPGGEEGIQRLAALTGQSAKGGVLTPSGMVGGSHLSRLPGRSQDDLTPLGGLTPSGIVGGSLNPAHGKEGPRSLVRIDEAACIGCTLCIQACPVDCIVGAPKHMHVVMADHCTGCELCLPACPVDCMHLEDATPGLTAWNAWSAEQAGNALKRYERRSARLARDAREQEARLNASSMSRS